MKHDPHQRIELTGPWAGFGFQGGHMWTPEGHTLLPEDMVWWSLTCNIAREWRAMMAAARDPLPQSGLSEIPCATRVSGTHAPGGHVIYLQDVIRRRQQERSSGQDQLGPK
ncbi:DUF3653 domain-containing protein [Stenotrophomonas humi]